jgi:biopolymer transport protein ExbD
MKKRSMPEMKEGGVNVTPLIDIVMCLIIFFMLVAKIGVTDGSDKSIDIPYSQFGKELKDHGNMLTLNVRQRNDEGEPLVTGLVEGATGGKPIEIQLQEGNRFPLREILKKLSKSNDKFGIIIRAEKEATYQTIVPVLTTCMEANVKNINLNTSTKPQ